MNYARTFFLKWFWHTVATRNKFIKIAEHIHANR